MRTLDIVIVNWNAGAQLMDCVQSVEALRTQPDFELSKCIVVDNASQDGSADGLKTFPLHLKVIRNTVNRGFGAACNQGAAAGEGDCILFLNPDVKLFPDSLVRVLSFLEEPESQGIGLLGIQLVDEGCKVQPSTGRFPTPGALVYQMIGLDRIWPARFPPFVMTDWDHEESRAVDVVQGAFLLVRRAAFEKLGGFDERFFMYYEDVDLAYRARKAGWAAYYFAGAQAFHRGGGTTGKIPATRLSYWLTNRMRYVDKHFGRPSALEVVLASFTLEFACRLVWNILTSSWSHLLDTGKAYRTYATHLPESLRSWQGSF